MGASWYTHAAIGCSIPKNMLAVKKKARGCEHTADEATMAGARYCSRCGKKMWIEVTVGVNGFDPENPEKFKGFPVVWPSDDNYQAIICVKGGLVNPGDSMMRKAQLPDDLTPLIKELFSMMSESGLYGFTNANHFGLWVIHYNQ
jgi:hypothetical protein